MKKTRVVALFPLFAFILIIIHAGCTTAPKAEEIKASVEIVDMETKWVSKYYQPWPPRLILAPAISFHVKNISEKPLRYLFFNAIFRLKDDQENLGDSLQAGPQADSIMPGETSDAILMKSNFGVEGKLLSDFKDNPHWKIATVKLFIKIKGSQYVLLKELDVSRKIDFKEPEPVGMEKKKEDSSS